MTVPEAKNQLTGEYGGCDCGKVRYRLKATPMFVHCCHCRWCQRETGSAFCVNMIYEIDNVEMLTGDAEIAHKFGDTGRQSSAGETAAFKAPTPSHSGLSQDMFRCPDCYLMLWSNYEGAGSKLAFVRAGTLDRANLASPDIHIFTSTKVPWFDIPEGKIPVCEEYYDRKQHWPQESLDRIKVVLESYGLDKDSQV